MSVSTRDRQRWLGETSTAVAAVIASVDVLDVDGNLYVAKPALVAALAKYFATAGVDGAAFIDRCYGAAV
jgi:hypothetical protein